MVIPSEAAAVLDTRQADASGAKMLAAVFKGPQQIAIEAVPIPLPGPGQIRVRLQGCGLCASNLGPWIGAPWFQYPFAAGAPGHEGWGIVDAIGAGAVSPPPGTRVTIFSQNAYGQYDVLPAENALPLPSRLDGLPFPGEPLGCAMNIFKRSRIAPDQAVVIIGIGFLGALLTQLCVAQGARVIAVSRRPYSLRMAQQSGARTGLSSQDPDTPARIMEMTSGQGATRVIEAVGMQWALDLATQIMAVRGRLIIAGYHQDGPRSINMQQWNWRGIDVVNAHERDNEIYLQGIREAIEAVDAGRIDPAPLYTHRYRLEELPDAFETLQQRPEGFLKAWIKL